VSRLGEGWHELEGVFGNKYRWIGPRATLKLRRVNSGPQRIRVRGHLQEQSFKQGKPVTLEMSANGTRVGQWQFDRIGLFVVEADLPDAAEHHIEIKTSPEWSAPNDARLLTVNLSMIRLVPRESD
jgi:hypothetical protein